MATLDLKSFQEWSENDWKSAAVHVKDTHPVKVAIVATILVLWLSGLFTGSKVVKASFAGYRKWWEPTILVRARFVQGARPIIMEGYAKVSEKVHR
jgi:hypothetical protein